MNAFSDGAAAIRDDLVALRRRLHACPEVGLDLPATQRVLLDALAGLGLEIGVGRGLSSITAVLRGGGGGGGAVLLRADMDALPVAEATGVEYASTNGAMHACGHDLHMAGLVGAARLLAERRAELAGDVVFMFQPGEEGMGGARVMIEEGVLEAAGERAVAAYALHVDCSEPAGRLSTREGALLAGSSSLVLTVTGTGGHAASPHLSADPVPAAAEIIMAVQTFVARRIPVTDPAVVSITGIETNSAATNVLPSQVVLRANIRTLSHERVDQIRTELPALATRIAAAHGCGLTSEFTASYPVTLNDAVETRRAMAAAATVTPVHTLGAPAMASEDFSYVLSAVPGTMLFLGARPQEQAPQDAPALHSDRAVFDDGVLGLQAAVLATLAFDRV